MHPQPVEENKPKPKFSPTASLGDRLYAGLIDNLVILAVIFFTYMIPYLGGLIVIGFTFGYFHRPFSVRRLTLGTRAAKIYPKLLNGERFTHQDSFRWSLARTMMATPLFLPFLGVFLYVPVWFVFMIPAVITERNQTLTDLVTGVVWVKKIH